ncbi:MAG: peptidylprolyl isomerase [Chloroflexi bacterium CFX4]|nr:peptidylprolyl isomerase [Chloroflexi bacterium CFX4]MDL1923140.1 peptidylprolyl isomerase [Chloroflexi bacterium CFX3]
MPDTIQNNVVVALAYTLKLENGEVVDESDAEDPLEYLHGAGNIIPGLERELSGMRVGETKRVQVSPAEGYGEYDPEDTEVLPRAEFPTDVPLTAGMVVTLADAEDNYTEAVIREVSAESITLDYNHPLAGETLFFDVEVLSLREATPEEIAHGHVHGTEYDFEDMFDEDDFEDDDFEDDDFEDDFDEDEEDLDQLRKN